MTYYGPHQTDDDIKEVVGEMAGANITFDAVNLLLDASGGRSVGEIQDIVGGMAGQNLIYDDPNALLDVPNRNIQAAATTDPFPVVPEVQAAAFQPAGFTANNTAMAWVSGNQCYMPAANNTANPELYVVDVSDPTNPSTLGSGVTTSSFFTYAFVVNDHAFLFAGGSNGTVQAVDVGDPTSPTAQDTISPGSNGWPAGAIDQTLYVVDNTSGLYGIDISDPTALSQLFFVDDASLDAGNGRFATRDDGYVFISDNADRLVVFDVSDPNNVTEVASTDSGDSQSQYQLRGDYLFRSDDGHVFDVSDPTAPTQVSTIESGYFGLEILGDVAYQVNGTNVAMTNIADPEDPYLIDTFVPASLSFGITMTKTEEYVIITDTTDDDIIVIG